MLETEHTFAEPGVATRIATTELRPGQTLASFLSALSQKNGLSSSERFCLAFWLNRRSISSGRPDMIAELARLAEVDAGLVLKASARSDRQHRVAGEPFRQPDLALTVRVCPYCLQDDQEQSPTEKFEVAAWYRVSWTIKLVETCASHGVKLVELPLDPRFPDDDFGAQLRALGKRDATLLVAEPQVASRMETYLQMRLVNEPTGLAFCDEMTISDGLFLWEFMGTPHRAGRRAFPPIDFAERKARVERGFEIAAAGREAVRQRLDEIADTINPDGAAEIGLRCVFTTLFERLRQKTGDDMRSVRELLVEIGIDKNLIPIDDPTALGIEVPARDLMTLSSGIKKFGISDRELRATLIELGVIPHDSASKPPNKVLFKTQAGNDVLALMSQSLNLAQAAEYLSIHTSQLVRLVEEGLVQPFFTRPSADLKPLRYFQLSELDAFTARVTANCVRVKSVAGRVDIWEAALKTCRQPVDIIAAILDGRIARTYRAVSVVKIRYLLVELDDVRAAVQQNAGLLSAEDCAQILKIAVGTMRKLMRAGHIDSVMAPNPVNLRPQLSASPEVVKAFDEEYICLYRLKTEYRSNSEYIAKTLLKVGVMPAFPTECGVTVYRRKSIRRWHKQLTEAVLHGHCANPRKSPRRLFSSARS